MARVRELERGQNFRKYRKWAAVSLVGILVIAGAAYGISRLPKAAPTVHWHANFQTYVDNERIRFTNPAFDMSQAKSSIHLHLPDDMKLHLETKSDRLKVINFFHSPVGGDVTDSLVRLPAGVSRPGTFVTNETEKLALWYMPLNGTWTQITSGVADHSFKDGEKAVLLYGNYTTSRIEEIANNIPDVN